MKQFSTILTPNLATIFWSAVMEEVGRVSSSSVNFFLNFALTSLHAIIFFPAITAILSYVCIC